MGNSQRKFRAYLLVVSRLAGEDFLSGLAGWLAIQRLQCRRQPEGDRLPLLSLALVNIYGEQSTGELLYELSLRILPADMNHSNMAQVGRVASILSNKLGALGFGSHLALRATRIREAYLNSGLRIPTTLVDVITPNTMLDILVGLHSALFEESLILYIEGSQGIAYIVALLLALCPDDIFVTLENETIFQGQRRSVIVSIKADGQTQYGVESVLFGEKARSSRNFVSVSDEHRGIPWAQLKWDGCIAAGLDITFLEVGAQSTPELRLACADLIASILFSMSTEELHSQTVRGEKKLTKLPLPRGGLKSLLGPLARNRVRDCLLQTLLAEPSFIAMDVLTAYQRLRYVMDTILPRNICRCQPNCFDVHVWATDYMRDLPGVCQCKRIWKGVAAELSRGIAAVFVTAGENTTVGYNYSNARSMCNIVLAVMQTVGRERFPTSYCAETSPQRNIVTSGRYSPRHWH